jgi:hypothetical protein
VVGELNNSDNLRSICRGIFEAQRHLWAP